MWRGHEIITRLRGSGGTVFVGRSLALGSIRAWVMGG